MPEERINRKLAAILASDVVGYSRLMGADEAGTLSALKQHRTPTSTRPPPSNGRIVKVFVDGPKRRARQTWSDAVRLRSVSKMLQRRGLPPMQTRASRTIVLE